VAPVSFGHLLYIRAETSVFPKLATVQLFLFKSHPFWCGKVREPLCLAHGDPGIVHGRKVRKDVAQLTPREFELGLTRIDFLLMPVPRPLDAVWVDGPSVSYCMAQQLE